MHISKNQKYIIALGGPTASGKTSSGIQIAQHYSCPIISADSRQVYKEMSIGTAKPTDKERSIVDHYLVDIVTIHESYSVGDYERDALVLLDQLFKKLDVVIVSGGTGLFLKALIEGIDIFPEVNKEDKEYYVNLWEEQGIAPLQKELSIKDPTYHNLVDLSNPHRLIRALSVIRTSNLPFSSFLNQKDITRNFQSILIALDRPRKELYSRINIRVDQMITEGLLDEVKSLYNYKNLKSLNTVGYKELFAYLNDECTLEYAIDKIKQHSRNYAKRQITWFKNQQDYTHFHPEEIRKIIEYIDKYMGGKF